MGVFYQKVRNLNKKTKLSDPDIIIGSSPQPFAALAAERLASDYNIPFFMEVRDLWPQSLIDLGKTSKYHPFIILLAMLEKYLYKKAAKIVTALPGASNYISELGFPKGKIVWISNGIDLTLVPEFNKSMQNNVFTVMYTGAHGVANSLDTILYAADSIMKQFGEKILFRFIGDGVEKNNLKNLSSNLKLENVVFEDPVPKKDIYNILNEADAFIAVSKKTKLYRWGISPNKLFDYFAMSKPVVLGVEAYNDPVKEAGAGISVSPEDPQALAEAILKLYNMPVEEREEMGLRGRRHVEDNYDFKKLAEKLEVVLLESIESKLGKSNA
ncbi:MAG TPA: glycosyltransferase WbuB [Syntrophomonas sp.]|jgi:glycosyltransferase involved in cell wall biosynthesis|nr:glycosyltransferase WbuB [Syntrophomonas sp.]